jgi:hypothetical protein
MTDKMLDSFSLLEKLNKACDGYSMHEIKVAMASLICIAICSRTKSKEVADDALEDYFKVTKDMLDVGVGAVPWQNSLGRTQ